jgi:L-malate glycosyltransferase
MDNHKDVALQPSDPSDLVTLAASTPVPSAKAATTGPVKILFLIDKLVPSGSQTNLFEIVTRLNRQLFEPFVIALVGGGELEKEFAAHGVKPIVLKTGRTYSLSGLSTLLFLIRFMRTKKIDIIQTHFLHADILGSIAGRCAGVKKIVTTRRDEGFWRSTRQLFLNRFFNRFTDGIAVNSEAVRRVVSRDENILPGRIFRIYNGIDLERFYASEEIKQTTRRSLGLRSNDTVIGVVANMRHPIKGQRYLIEAMPLILKSISNAQLLLVGDGPLRANFEALAESLGVRSHIHFLGVRRDINALLNAMDIYCLPSLTEGFSNSLLEAMACQKPCVATEVGGNPEIVKNGETGFLVPPQNSRALAESILDLAQQPFMRSKMGEAGFDRVQQQFSIRKMVLEYEQFYKHIVEQEHRDEAKN